VRRVATDACERPVPRDRTRTGVRDTVGDTVLDRDLRFARCSDAMVISRLPRTPPAIASIGSALLHAVGDEASRARGVACRRAPTRAAASCRTCLCSSWAPRR
jgi:hypothetical protein